MKKRILALTLTAALTIGGITACADSSAAKGSGVGGLVGNEVANDGTITINGGLGSEKVGGTDETSSLTVDDDGQTEPTASSADMSKTSSMYAAYDGYAYVLESGQVKYRIESRDGFKIHCFFRSGSPDYYEEVYTINLNRAIATDGAMMVRTIKDSKGNDISKQFELLMFSFEDNQVVMTVRRNENTVAGSEDDSMMSGKYVLTPRKTKATSKKKK